MFINQSYRDDNDLKFSSSLQLFQYEEDSYEDSKMHMSIRKPFFIGVTGGTASGKTTVCQEIVNRLNDQRITTISLDSFYKPLSDEEIENVISYNLDHPNAFDWELLINVLDRLSNSKSVMIPNYDFSTYKRLEENTQIHGSLSDVILLEGIFAFHHPSVLEFLDMKIFVDADSDTRLSRRVVRDMKFIGRDLDHILYQYETFVKPAFDTYIFPTMKLSDVVIPGGKNSVAINLLEQHVRRLLVERNQDRLSRFKQI